MFPALATFGNTKLVRCHGFSNHPSHLGRRRDTSTTTLDPRTRCLTLALRTPINRRLTHLATSPLRAVRVSQKLHRQFRHTAGVRHTNLIPRTLLRGPIHKCTSVRQPDHNLSLNRNASCSPRAWPSPTRTLSSFARHRIISLTRSFTSSAITTTATTPTTKA